MNPKEKLIDLIHKYPEAHIALNVDSSLFGDLKDVCYLEKFDTIELFFE